MKKTLILIIAFLAEISLVAAYFWIVFPPVPVFLTVSVLALVFWTLKGIEIARAKDAPWWMLYYTFGGSMIVGCVSGLLAGFAFHETWFTYLVGAAMFSIDLLTYVVAYYGEALWKQEQ